MAEMSEEELRRIIHEVTHNAVHQTLVSLGLDPSKPIEMQQQMFHIREMSEMMNDPEFQADQIHLRRWRKSVESASKIGFKTIFTTILTGALAIIGVLVMEMIKNGRG